MEIKYFTEIFDKFPYFLEANDIIKQPQYVKICEGLERAPYMYEGHEFVLYYFEKEVDLEGFTDSIIGCSPSYAPGQITPELRAKVVDMILKDNKPDDTFTVDKWLYILPFTLNSKHYYMFGIRKHYCFSDSIIGSYCKEHPGMSADEALFRFLYGLFDNMTPTSITVHDDNTVVWDDNQSGKHKFLTGKKVNDDTLIFETISE